MQTVDNNATARAAHLRVWSEPDQGIRQEFSLDKPEHWLGREAPCDLIVNATIVSRKHAHLERLPDGRYRITDNNSSNHLFVNGQQVPKWSLADGDIVEIGDRHGAYVICVQFQQAAQQPQSQPAVPQPQAVVQPPAPKYVSAAPSDPFAQPPTARQGTAQAQQVVIQPPAAPRAASLDQNRKTRLVDDESLSALRPVLYVADSTNQFNRAYPLEKPQMTLGRDDSCDITVPLNIVSRLHATLYQVGADYKIVDNNSSNHLFVNGQQVQEAILREGQTVVIGRVEDRGYTVGLTFRRVSAENEAPAAFPPIDLRNITTLTLGRDPQPANDVQLDHPVVSAKHLRFARNVQGEITVEDLGSTNGTLLNGDALKPRRPVPLRDGVLLKVGPYRIEFRNGVLSAFNEQGVVKLDALNLSVDVGKGGVKRLILNDVSLSIQPCEFVAVLGGSGAGKSTLMQALSGFKPADAPARVIFNGQDYYAGFDNYRSLVGYVPQADIIHTELTVQAALTYAARLRLPPGTGDDEIAARVREAIQTLRLTGREDVEVGRLSGGQRKRVSIGVELLTKPSLFFLDEPTSGLDPGLEAEMMALMRELAERGHTIIMVTHALANIDKCHKVVFMADGGQLVFFGSAEQAREWFGVTEYHEIYNITGIDVVVVKGQRVNITLPDDVADWVADLKHQFEADPQMVNRSPKEISLLWVQALAGRFRASQQYARTITGKVNAPQQSAAPVVQRPAQKKLFDVRQFGLLSRRYIEIVSRDRRNLIFLLLQAPIIGAILAVVGRLGDGMGVFKYPYYDLKQEQLLAMLGCSVIWFGILNSAREIVRELPIYKRERMVNLSVGSYVFSKLAVLVGLCVIQVALLLAVTLPFTGVPKGVVFGLGETYLTLLLGAIDGVALGLALSAAMSNSERVTAFMPLILLPQIILNPVLFYTPVSYFLTSGWTVYAMGGIVDINGNLASLGLPEKDSMFYPHNIPGLFVCWFALALIAVVFIGLALFLQRRRDSQAI